MDFTIKEQARLLRLRQRVREAGAGSGRLYDDMVPDLSSGRTLVLSPSASSASSASSFSRFPPRGSRVRYIPGPLANRARYLSAVNAASARGVDLESAVLLDQKQTMDRWEAVLTVGMAMILATIAHRTRRTADSS